MKKFVFLIVGVVAAVIIGGFFMVGSPNKERLRRFDDLRLQHLQVIQSELIAYWQVKEDLPEQLDTLAYPLRGFTPPLDPQIGAPYEYTKKGSTSFTLCATFAETSRQDQMYAPRYAPYSMVYPIEPGLMNANWDHPAGRTCFERVIDPDFYKSQQRIISG